MKGKLLCHIGKHDFVEYAGIRFLLLHDGPDLDYIDGLGSGTRYDCRRNCGAREVRQEDQ